MKHTITYSNLVVIQRKGRKLWACPVQHQPNSEDSRPVHPAILSVLGFESDGTMDGSMANLSFSAYEQKVRDFFAKDTPKDFRLLYIRQAKPIVGCRGQLTLIVEADVSEDLPADAMFQFSETFSRGDLTKWGASDFYDDKREELVAALASGKPFDTGWGGCKKEILTSRVFSDGKTLTCEVSVSDDFDTEGLGSITIAAPATFEQVEGAMDRASNEAESCRKENADYTGFAIHKGDADGSWVETYVAQRSDMAGYMDTPPGDNYHKWGFQGDGEEIAEDTAQAIEDHIHSHQFDEDFLPFSVGGYTVTRWK